ncbi:MAG: ribbon-helix-helix protein, CopG family [Bacillota bacterium]|nr:ribbon-helix-helix protein, CopG family [Bacillota bacterium]
MFSIRLPRDLEIKINNLSKQKKLNKSEIVREAIQEYIAKAENEESPFDLGKELFGRYSSGDGNLSETYKHKIKEKIREKHPD